MRSSTLTPVLDPVVMTIALRASNLSERTRILTAHRDDQPAEPSDADLDPLDGARITAMADALSAQFTMATEKRSTEASLTAEQLTSVLTAFDRLEADGVRSPALRELISDVHASWLPSYRLAMSRHEASTEPARAPWWRERESFYGRAAIVCAPFLLLMESELTTIGPGLANPAPASLVQSVQRQLLDRFELALVWAIEVHTKVHCARFGVDPEQATQDQYTRFLDQAFADADSYHAFFQNFPVLGRWLAEVSTLLINAARTLWIRLNTDRSLIETSLFNSEINAFTTFTFGQGDSHAGGQTVARVAVRLRDGSETAFIYKPRCVRAEAGMQTLLGRLRDEDVLTAAPRQVIPMAGYGYEELIPTDRNTVDTTAEVELIYRELGGYLALFYVLGGGDLHHENIIIAEGHVQICDCETVFGLLLAGDVEDRSDLLDSVFRTGLLEWPANPTQDSNGGEMRIGGYAGGEEFEIPVPVPQLNEDRLSFKSAVNHRSGIRVTPATTNRVFLNGTMMRPQDFTTAIQAGFDRVYDWFQRAPRRAAETVETAFAGASTRYIRWSTQIYHQLLVAVRHPKCLIDPLEADLIFNRLRTLPARQNDDPRMLAQEIAALWRWDVPLFSARIAASELLSDHTQPAVAELIRPPLAFARQRVSNLSAANRRRQAAYVAASLATSTHDKALLEACVAHAQQIGERLVSARREPGAPALWTAVKAAGGAVEEMDIEANLYNGSAGVSLFLAYLDAVSPSEATRETAARACADALARYERDRIGAFTGTAGVIYLLTHLGVLWRDTGLIERAVTLSGELSGLIDADRQYDVFGGVAGVIPVLLGLAEHADGAGLEVAESCARHLLRHAHDDGETLSWPLRNPSEAHANLTGLAHGAGGVGWALIALGVRLDRADLIDAGRRAMRYESRHFDGGERDWPDLRVHAAPANSTGKHFANAWCNGAAGIGLTRLAAWQLLGADAQLLDEARTALSTTVRKFRHLRNNTLCHGRSGNAELLLRFADSQNEPAYRLEAGVHAQEQWRNIDDSRLGIVDDNASFFPGLMLGISGFGMYYLRLAYPNRVPSALLLDPPPRDQGLETTE